MTAVIALAGHVDHGKSALVTALSGTATDRLAHEAASGHTIEVLPAHVPASGLTLLDVPGHLDWSDATLAGLGAATHALLVVAADDGIMPQTRDHLVAIRALGLPVTVAISRSDVAEARPDVVARAVTGELARLGVSAVPVVTTSAHTGVGVDALRARLAQASAPAPTPPLAGPDLWVDRTFPVPGRGRVAIGTLRRGTVAVGDDLVAAPDGTSVRIRGLQHRGEDVATATATSRVALRVAGDADLPRGTRLVAPALHRDGLVAAPFEAEVTPVVGEVGVRGAWTVHVGTAAVSARLRPRDDGVATGAAGLVTVVPDEPVAVRPGDTFVLRDTGRARVVGGGIVLATAGRGHGDGRAHHDLARALRDHDRGRIAAGLPAVHGGVVSRAHVATVVPLARADGWLLAADHHDAVLVAAREATMPTAGRPADAADEVAARVAATTHLPVAAVAAVLAEREVDGHDGTPPGPTDDAVVAAWTAHGWAPPTNDEVLAELGLDRGRLHALYRSGRLHAAGRWSFAPGPVEAAVGRLAGLPPPFTVADARDGLAVTRRHAVPLLELLDRLGHTRADAQHRRVVTAPGRDDGQP